MGIKDLNTVLKKYCPTYVHSMCLKEYAFQKIAVDISLYLYKYKAIAKSALDDVPESEITSYWISLFLDLICCLRSADIHCIFIYDGIAPPDKIIEQQRRRESLVLQKNKIERLELY